MAKRGRPKKKIGDKIKQVTESLGIEQCEACKKRQANINNFQDDIEYWFKKFKPSKFTEEQKEQWNAFRNNDSSKLSTQEQELIVSLTRDVFRMSFSPCTSCDASVYKKHIVRLNTAYDKQFS